MPGFGSFWLSYRTSFAKTAFTRSNAHDLISAPPRQEWFNHCRGGAGPFLMIEFTGKAPPPEAADGRVVQAAPRTSAPPVSKTLKKNDPQVAGSGPLGAV